MRWSKSVLVAEIVSLVAAVILVEWLATRLVGSSALWPILVYAAIRLFVGVAIRR